MAQKDVRVRGRSSLMYATADSRIGLTRLSGATVSGNIYVQLDHDPPDVERVDWYVDDAFFRFFATATPPAAPDEGGTPFDLAGDDRLSGNLVAPFKPNAFDTRLFVDGAHTIKAVVQMTGGVVDQITASFTTANSGARSAKVFPSLFEATVTPNTAVAGAGIAASGTTVAASNQAISVVKNSLTIVTPSSGTPTNLGSDIRTYIGQTGGQTIIVPNGNYSSGLVSDKTHSSWLYLVAQTPGQVVVPGINFKNCSRVVFVGFKFTSGLEFGSNAGTLAEISPWICDRLVFWHCEITNPSGQFGLHPAESNNICALGCQIHNMLHDAIQDSSFGTRLEGCRTWSNTDPSGFYHPDAYQTLGSIRSGQGTVGATIKQCVFSLDLSDVRHLDGHFQIGNERSGTPVVVRLSDSWQTNSGNYGFTVDAKFRNADTTLYRTNVKSWQNGFSGNNSTLTLNGGNTIDSNYAYGTDPRGTATAPDILWKNANPISSYQSWIANSGL